MLTISRRSSSNASPIASNRASGRSGSTPNTSRSDRPQRMPLDLTDDETAALIELLQDTVDRDRSLTSPRIRKLQAILAKLALEPPEPPRPTASQAAPNPRSRQGAALAKRRR